MASDVSVQLMQLNNLIIDVRLKAEVEPDLAKKQTILAEYSALSSLNY